VHQKDFNTYLMLNFGTPESSDGLRIAGNIGVRYVKTDLDSNGATIVPNQAALNITQPYNVRCAPPRRRPALLRASRPLCPASAG
jgi:hypothetical protein